MDRVYRGGIAVSHYLVIPELQVQNANAQPASWMIGPPPITAYMGFAHALCLRLHARHNGVAIVHHDIEFPGEWIHGSFRPTQFKGASFVDKDDYIAGTNTLSSQPTARCHLSCSLVIRFPEEESLDKDKALYALRSFRLAGGEILRHGKIMIFSHEREREKVRNELIRKVRKSHWSIVDRVDLMVREAGDRDMLDTLLRVTRQSKNFEKQEKNTDSAWLLPSTVGYAEISRQAHRRNVRGGLLHAYAEPLIGLIQYRNLRNKDVGLHFWSPAFPMAGVYFAKGENNQHRRVS